MKIKQLFCIVAALLCISLLAACADTPEPTSSETDAGITAGSTDALPTETASVIDVTHENDNDNEYDLTEVGAYEDGSKPSFSGTKLRLTVNGEEEVIIALYDNTAADALLERLPMENLSFYDLSGIEKPIRRPDDPLSLGQETPGYDPVTGEMVIYRPWANFTIFYGDFRYSSELVPLGKVESGLEIISGKTEDFTGVLELMK